MHGVQLFEEQKAIYNVVIQKNLQISNPANHIVTFM
jgi:hypothetical protein